MSLFKILKGDSARVGVDVTPFHDGYAYFTPDDGGFYIDSEDDGVQRRIRINPDEVEMSQVTGLDTALEAKADEADLTAHTGNTNNPHSVTAAQVGADPTGTATSAVNTHNQAQNAHSALFSAKANASDLTAHVDNTSNPHGVTAAQVGAATTSLYSGTLVANGWVGTVPPYTQTIAVAGMLSTDTPIADILQTGTESTDEAMRIAWELITRITSGAGSITVYASDLPESEIAIQMRVVR